MSEFDAADRRTLSQQQSAKEQRWPRTERRQSRVRGVLARRQPDLTIVLENVHDPHNVSAILRTCDAVGIPRVHTVYTVEQPPVGAFARQTSAGAAKWVDVDMHDSVVACYERLRSDGFRILATSLGPASRCLYDWDLTEPAALVFGNEMRGVSGEAEALADGGIVIPMMGMVQSLNVSVASAVCLYEAFRQRNAGGAYAATRFDEATLAALENEWLHK